MPVTIPPITTTRTVQTTEQVTATAAWIDRFSVDASGKQAAPATMVFVPYGEAKDGAPVFADKPITIQTKDLFAVAARIPSVAQWLGAAFAAAPDMLADAFAKQATLDAATAAAGKAREAEAAALAARAAAFAGRKTAEDPTWTNADAAWMAAKERTSLAGSYVQAAQAAMDPAHEPVSVDVAKAIASL